MSCGRANKLLVHRDVSIIFFVDIKVLYYALAEKVLEVFQPKCQVLYVSLHQLRFTLLANDQWSDESTSIRCDVNAIHLLVVVDRDKLLDTATLPQ